MKRMKKFLTLAIATAMVLGMTIPTMAAPGDLASDGKIQISGIDVGDVVKLYRIIKWDGDWVLDHEIPGIQVGDLTLNDTNSDGISLDEAVLIAKYPGNPIQFGDSTETAVGENGTFEAEVEPGMYLALIADKNNDTIYNPIFVSSDYDLNNGTHLIAVSGAILIGDTGSIAKKEDLTLEKVIDTDEIEDADTDKKSVAPGDVVPFKVTSNVPTYADNYTNPTYSISDKLSDGITMTEPQQSTENIKVTVEGYDELEIRDNESTTWDYEIVNISGKGFTVNFNETFLKSVHGNPAVTIQYKATVDEIDREAGDELDNVERFTNDVTLTFSNDPTDENSHGTRDDQTNHYTFSIDANLNGKNENGEVTKELVKIGVDSDGETVYAWNTYEEAKWEEITPLAGAEFQLVGGPNNVTLTATSDENGYISFYGLDAGEYTLTETKAPAGYVKDSTDHTVVITAVYKDVVDEKDGSTTEVLDYYTITIDGNNVSKYTIENSGTDATITEITKDDNNVTTPIVNTKGVELPSTGGIGTTIFYVVGGILVIGAGILLVVKKRMNSR